MLRPRCLPRTPTRAPAPALVLGVGPPAPLAGRPTCTPSVARPAGRSAHVDVGGPRDARLLRRPLRPRHLAAQLHARLPGTCTTPTPTPMLRPMPRPTLPYLDLSYTLTPHWRRRVMCSLCIPPDRGGAARGEDARLAAADRPPPRPGQDGKQIARRWRGDSVEIAPDPRYLR